VLLGSADLMPRNLNRRVEILFPVRDKGILRKIRDEILPVYMRDNMKTRVLHADGVWEHVWPGDGEEHLNAQEWFVTQAREAVLRQGEE
jgi:polyphosphate kinase